MEFEGIYRTYFKAVYLYVLRLSGDEHIAEEITSEAFFKAIRSVDGFRGECEIRVWLCQIAKNTYYSYLKNTKGYRVSRKRSCRKWPIHTERFFGGGYWQSCR